MYLPNKTYNFSHYRKGTPSYIYHGLNQSYDSFVNYTNRNGDTKLAASQIRFGVSGIAATILSTLAAYRFEKLLNKKMCNPILYVNKYYYTYKYKLNS